MNTKTDNAETRSLHPPGMRRQPRYCRDDAMNAKLAKAARELDEARAEVRRKLRELEAVSSHTDQTLPTEGAAQKS